VKVKVNSKSYDTYSSPQFCKEFNQFVLSSFLRLATLLDRCKNCKVIERNPCLFTKYGEIRFGSTWFKPLNFKSTKEAVTCFSKEFLSGEGDVIRHLTLLGVNLTFQQCALDEYEFNVSNLFSDLRDGVVLAKIVDIVNEQSDELSSKLRVPAISRLQKVR
jgi:abnormal spindle-like microcephaly-associated protein